MLANANAKSERITLSDVSRSRCSPRHCRLHRFDASHGEKTVAPHDSVAGDTGKLTDICGATNRCNHAGVRRERAAGIGNGKPKEQHVRASGMSGIFPALKNGSAEKARSYHESMTCKMPSPAASRCILRPIICWIRLPEMGLFRSLTSLA
jgi:hypothetical protein